MKILISPEDEYLLDIFDWQIRSDGYVYCNVFEKTYYLHRMILPTMLEVDHRDRNPSNCTRENLREATHSQNMVNWVRKNKSGYRGVHESKDRKTNRFVAEVRWKGLCVFKERFPTALEAARAYDKEALFWHKEFAILNGV